MNKTSARKRIKASSSDESGFSLVEMVIAIPIVFLILGLVMTSVGVTTELMGQVTKRAGAAKMATLVVDDLNTARNCAEASYIMDTYARDASSKYEVDFRNFDCESGTVAIDVKIKDGTVVHFSENITMAVV